MCTVTRRPVTPSISPAIWTSEAAWPAPRSVTPARTIIVPSCSSPIQQDARSAKNPQRPYGCMLHPNPCPTLPPLDGAVTFGDYGIQALEPAYVTNRQIESARIAINRHIRRGGKVWINIYPDRPLTKKPAETRMGSGKGSPEWWVANIKPGRVLFEMSYPTEAVAREALRRAIHKPPMKRRIVPGRVVSSDGEHHDELRELGQDELVARLHEHKEELFNLRVPDGHRSDGQHPRPRTVRHDIARIYTVMRERESSGCRSGLTGRSLQEVSRERATGSHR